MIKSIIYTYSFFTKEERESMAKTIKEDTKALKIQKQLEKAIHRSLADGKEVVFSRTQLAKRFNCNPALISYVLGKINAQHTMKIESKRGVNGYIKIKPYSDSIKKILIPKTITAKRQQEIDEKIEHISNVYFENLINNLPANFILNPLVAKLVFCTICKTVLIEGNESNDSRMLALIQIALENTLAAYKHRKEEAIEKASSLISEETNKDAESIKTVSDELEIYPTESEEPN